MGPGSLHVPSDADLLDAEEIDMTGHGPQEEKKWENDVKGDDVEDAEQVSQKPKPQARRCRKTCKQVPEGAHKMKSSDKSLENPATPQDEGHKRQEPADTHEKSQPGAQQGHQGAQSAQPNEKSQQGHQSEWR